MEFVNDNIQKTAVADSELSQVYAKNEDIKVYGKLVSMSTENVVADSEQIWDDKQRKNQQDINKELCDAKDQYVKKTGDTMTGDLYIQDGKIDADSADIAEVAHISEDHFSYSDKSGKTLYLDNNGLLYGSSEDNPVFKVDSDGIISKQITVPGYDNSHTIIQPNEISVSNNENELTISPTNIAINGLIDIKTETQKSKGLVVSLNSLSTVETNISPNSIQMIKEYDDGEGLKTLQTLFEISDGSLKAGKIAKYDGKPTQFLMADGSIKSLADKNGVASLDANGYVPLSQLGNIDTQIAIVVKSLPTVDIKSNKIYLVPNTAGKGDNIYDEYIYINNKWEKLGEYKAEVDLSQYARLDQENTFTTNQTIDGDIVANCIKTKNGDSTFDINISNVPEAHFEYNPGSNNIFYRGVYSATQLRLEKVQVVGESIYRLLTTVALGANGLIIAPYGISTDTLKKRIPSCAGSFIDIGNADDATKYTNIAPLGKDGKVPTKYIDDSNYAKLNDSNVFTDTIVLKGAYILGENSDSNNLSSLSFKRDGIEIAGHESAIGGIAIRYQENIGWGISSVSTGHDSSAAKLYATDGSIFDASTLATTAALNTANTNITNLTTTLNNIQSNNKIKPTALPAASASTLGCIKLGYQQQAQNYPIRVDEGTGTAYVNVPWTDNQDLSKFVTLDGEQTFGENKAFAGQVIFRYTSGSDREYGSILNLGSQNTGLYTTNNISYLISNDNTTDPPSNFKASLLNEEQVSFSNYQDSLTTLGCDHLIFSDGKNGIFSISSENGKGFIKAPTGSQTDLFAANGSLFDASTLSSKKDTIKSIGLIGNNTDAAIFLVTKADNSTTNLVFNPATNEKAGLMSSSDKIKLGKINISNNISLNNNKISVGDYAAVTIEESGITCTISGEDYFKVFASYDADDETKRKAGIEIMNHGVAYTLDLDKMVELGLLVQKE